MTTKKICVLPCFQSFLCADHYNFNKGYLIQVVFKDIQGLLWKTQGLFKHIPQFFNFQGFSRT